jgi:AbrB family looped-hinge helix DNA binding protein
MALNMETTATAEGQIVIPAEMRRRLGIKEGARILLELDEEEKRIVLKPITRKPMGGLRGKYRDAGALKALIEDREWEGSR